MEFKYIMMNDGTRDIPLIFPKQVSHISMYEATRGLEENTGRPLYWKLVSAGFVNLIEVSCWGESESLKGICPDFYKSRPSEDTTTILLYQWQFGVYEPESAKILLVALRDSFIKDTHK